MPFRPTLRQLEYVVALEAARHFGKAATRCHVSQPTLSVQVALLERQLGAALFERAPAGVAPTPLGVEVARRARLALAQADDIVALAARDTQALGGLIRLGSVPSFGPYFLPRLLTRLHHAHPALRLYIHEDRPIDIEHAVAEGTLDCGVGPQVHEAGLTFRPIGVERFHVGLPAEHPLAQSERLTLADLRDAPLLSLGAGHRLAESIRALAQAAGARLIEDYEGTSLDSIRQMISIGMGISIFPELYARAEFREGDGVVLRGLDDWAGSRAVGFFWREGHGRAPHFEALALMADEEAQTLALAAPAR